jgi:transmembrane protein TMEM260 (protein O-mannosyltransferase)
VTALTPRRAAVAVFVAVLTGYLVTLAPSVTFWDAGEFIATAKILGIPHPPGTPLFVMLANVWAKLVPIGEFAWRTNLMSAVFSAGAATCFFLLLHRVLASQPAAVRWGGSVAGAWMSAFVFTVWQNSNETEVYMVATFSIAAICWLCWHWREARGTPRAAHYLLVIVYLAAVAVGAHLMTLLVGPAVAWFVWHVLRTRPATDPAERRVEWAEWAVLCSLWGLLIAVGLGRSTLLIVFGVAFVGAAVYAGMSRNAAFPIVALLVAAVGVSTYLFLFIRAGQNPIINEADPSTWENLLAVIRREQYPVRSPLDDPTFLHGPDNPGRTPLLFLMQVVNYLQYADWQWAASLARDIPAGFTPRLVFTLIYATFGVMGAVRIARTDRSASRLLLGLWLITGLGMIIYMNFKPGFALFFDQYPDSEQHEVRERDYFFLVSFQVWGLFAGVGVAALVQWLWETVKHRAAYAAFALAGLPFVLNFAAASRRHGIDVDLPRDFAYDLLQSVGPYGVIFTYGDNDTFPVWYAQEVEGIRQDVTVVNLSLGNLDWYIRQLRDRPVRPFDPARAPAFYTAPAEPPPRLHDLTDAQIRRMQPFYMDSNRVFRAGRIEVGLERGQPVRVQDQLVLTLVAGNQGRRPLAFASSAGPGVWAGLDPYLVEEGVAYRIADRPTREVAEWEHRLYRVATNVGRTDTLAWQVYRYADLFEADSVRVDPTARFVTGNLSMPFIMLGQSYALRGDEARTLANLERAHHLSPSMDLAQLITAIRTRGLRSVMGGDSTSR